MKFFDKLKKNYELKKDKKQKNKEREKYHKEVLLDEKKNKSNKKIAPNDAYILIKSMIIMFKQFLTSI